MGSLIYQAKEIDEFWIRLYLHRLQSTFKRSRFFRIFAWENFSLYWRKITIKEEWWLDPIIIPQGLFEIRQDMLSTVQGLDPWLFERAWADSIYESPVSVIEILLQQFCSLRSQQRTLKVEIISFKYQKVVMLRWMFFRMSIFPSHPDFFSGSSHSSYNEFWGIESSIERG